MKKGQDLNSKIINYIDASCKNDESFLLIANLLTQTGQPLEAVDCRRVGDLIRDYLNMKILLDHYFWKRSLYLCNYSESELELRISFLRSGILI